mgnify:CR=1 FL=1
MEIKKLFFEKLIGIKLLVFLNQIFSIKLMKVLNSFQIYQWKICFVNENQKLRNFINENFYLLK